jgi:pimeloyl-ACP methyl ester carboxylesterase
MESEVRNLTLRTGTTMPCLVQGDVGAAPLLLLHAWGESRRCFDRLLPGLASFRVYAPDLRGQGEAEKPENGYSLAEQAEDAAAIMDAAGVETAFVLGSSSGGYVAQQLAVLHPGRVAAMVLVGSPLSLKGRPAFAEEVDRLAGPINEDWVRASLSWFTLHQPVPDWYLEDRVRDGVRMPAHAWKKILAGLTAAVPPTEAGAIRTPTLILYGGQDDLLPRQDQEVLASRIPGAVLKVYPDSGHLVLWECPDRVAADASTFLHALENTPAGPNDSAPFYHGTKASLRPGDLLVPGYASNYGGRNAANHIYFTATLDAAAWGAELSAGEGPGRIYRVEPTGPFQDDPNLTDKKFPGNPTRSYRTREPLRVLDEVKGWQPHSPKALQHMRSHLEELKRQGIEAID